MLLKTATPKNTLKQLKLNEDLNMSKTHIKTDF